MFKASLKVDRKDLLVRRERASRNLDKLKDKSSAYADDHRALISYIDDMLYVVDRHTAAREK